MKLRNEPKKGRYQSKNTKNEPKTSQQRLEARLDICTIFIRAVATGGIRGSDVMGKVGEIPGRGDVTGRT